MVEDYVIVLKPLSQIVSGDVIIPDGFVIAVDPAWEAKQNLQNEITQLTEQLASMTEPSEQELADTGRMMHPYYEMQLRLEMLNSQVNSL